MTKRCSWLRAVSCLTLLAAALLAGACGSKTKTAGPAPATFKAQFITSKGDFTILVHRDWAPLGADRFYELLKIRYFDGNYFFRVLPGFVVQWGENGDPAVTKDWRQLTIKDDPVKMSNKRGTITFATDGPNTRTTQVFVNLADNSNLDQQGFSPFGEVTDGMNVIESFYSRYGDGPPRGAGPDQKAIEDDGNDYLQEHFPSLDKIRKVTIEP